MSSIGKYFLGVSSPTGYSSFFEQLTASDAGLHTWILKCGPWSIKQVLRNIANYLEKTGIVHDQIISAGNPDELDAIICQNKNFAIVDGTEPHLLEAKFPLARQDVISFNSVYDRYALIDNFEKIAELTEESLHYTIRAKRFIAAAGSLVYDVERTAYSSIFQDILKRYITNLCRKLFQKRAVIKGNETIRLLSALTSDGILDFSRENFANYTYRHEFVDRFGAMAHTALSMIRDIAVASGFSVISCRSPLSAHDKIDAVAIPSLSMVFLHNSYLTQGEKSGTIITYDHRFYDNSVLSGCQRRMIFCKKAALDLIAEGCHLLHEAKKTDQELQEIYKRNTDIEKMSRMEKDLMKEIGI